MRNRGLSLARRVILPRTVVFAVWAAGCNRLLTEPAQLLSDLRNYFGAFELRPRRWATAPLISVSRTVVFTFASFLM